MSDKTPKQDVSATSKAKKNPAEHLAQYQWKPGERPLGAGRPKGSKNKLSEDFVAALCADFEENGPAVIATVRAEKPSDYLKIIASIVPKEFTVRTETLEDMSDEELLDSLEQVRSIATALVGAKASERSGAKSRDKAARGKPN
jgi:predicted house-cleaning noncanonical NTP pyrophosphatase (MazG superfamily)